MDGKLLRVGERYLFRLRGKQVPVILEALVPENVDNRLRFRRLDGGSPEIFYRRAARALSKHYDKCNFNFPNCGCAEQLAKK